MHNQAKISLKDQIAELFTFSAYAKHLDEVTERIVKDLKPGGMFLGLGCLGQPEQVHGLTTALQKASLEDGSGIPLFISADFIAGAGCKLKSGAVHFPKNWAIGAAGDEQLAYEAGRITAEESLAMGVNFNYSPVVDINNNPLNPVIGTHSFGADVETVSTLGNAVIRGYQEHGMIATAKHFPGHGDTHVDSHEDLPVLSFDRERLDSFELVPFQKAITAGVDAVMVGHMAVPALDPSLAPASLSYPITTTLLREQMNFQGLIVTDGLSMKGVTNQYSMEEACIQALIAGADILLATADDYAQAKSMLEAVLEAVVQGRIPRSRIEQSYERIMQMKRKYGLTPDTYSFTPYQADRFLAVGAEEVSAMLAAKAATPLNGFQRGALAENLEQGAWHLLRDQHTSIFADAVTIALSNIEEHVTESYDQLVNALSEMSYEQRIVIAISHNKPIAKGWLNEVNSKLGQFKEAIWIHFGSEFDVREVAVPCLLLYDRAPALQLEAARRLLEK